VVSGAKCVKHSARDVSKPRWLVITVQAPSDAQREALAEGLLALGGSAIEEDGSSLRTYVRAPANTEEWLEHARATLQTDFDWRWQADEDWSETWKQGLRARRVGKSFVVTPSWIRPEVHDGDRVIIVDPEMAFGTGEHATTRAALRFLEQVAKAGDRVLDVGTGSAILAIGAAQLGAREVVAVDNDADAILNARDNIVRNGVADRVKLEQGFVDVAFLRNAGDARFEIIVANVLSTVLKPLLASFHQSVVPSGYVILGGILEDESDDMFDACLAAGFIVMAEDLDEEWWSVLLRRPAA
jgi:ribosomal protein L11 methyltransferase